MYPEEPLKPSGMSRDAWHKQRFDETIAEAEATLAKSEKASEGKTLAAQQEKQGENQAKHEQVIQPHQGLLNSLCKIQELEERHIVLKQMQDDVLEIYVSKNGVYSTFLVHENAKEIQTDSFDSVDITPTPNDIVIHEERLAAIKNFLNPPILDAQEEMDI